MSFFHEFLLIIKLSTALIQLHKSKKFSPNYFYGRLLDLKVAKMCNSVYVIGLRDAVYECILLTRRSCVSINHVFIQEGNVEHIVIYGWGNFYYHLWVERINFDGRDNNVTRNNTLHRAHMIATHSIVCTVCIVCVS